MLDIVGIGPVTVDFPIAIEDLELSALGLPPRSDLRLAEERIAHLRKVLEMAHGALPEPLSGGSVANTTALIGKAHGNAGFIGVGGDDDFGRVFQRDFLLSRVDLLHPLQPGLASGQCFCFFNKKGATTIIWTSGANSTISPHIIDRAALSEAKLVVIDGGTFQLGEHGPDTVFHAVRTARELGVPYVMTLNSVEVVDDYRDQLQQLLPDAAFAVGNLSQAAAMTGMEGDTSPDEVISAMRRITPNVLMTMGGKGVYAAFGNEQLLRAPRTIDEEVIDTTGAGDALLGAFIVARQRGHSLWLALDIGNVVAAEIIRQKGARFPHEMNVEAFIERVIGTHEV